MPTTHASSKTARSVQHSREHALDDLEFERLLDGARRMKDYYEQEGVFLALLLGRLGLRRGEAAHLQEDWLNRRDQMLEIPLHYECDTGEDGGPCGYCRRRAQGIADYHDDPAVTVDGVLADMWMPKTDAASREIFYGFSARVEYHLEQFFEKYDQWPYSEQAIGRRVDRAAELAPGIDADPITPHILRATAATYAVGRGLSIRPLMQFFGWSDPGVAEVYIQRSGEHTRRQLSAVHSR